jgi:hypothetical protein
LRRGFWGLNGTGAGQGVQQVNLALEILHDIGPFKVLAGRSQLTLRPASFSLLAQDQSQERGEDAAAMVSPYCESWGGWE